MFSSKQRRTTYTKTAKSNTNLIKINQNQYRQFTRKIRKTIVHNSYTQTEIQISAIRIKQYIYIHTCIYTHTHPQYFTPNYKSILIKSHILIEMDVEDRPSGPKAVRSEIVAPVAAPRTLMSTGPPSATAAGERGEEQPRENRVYPRCSLCHRPHVLKRCSIFQSMKPAQRQQVARAHGHCMTCLADDHATIECWADGACQYCQLPHHTLFHRFPRRANPSSNHINTRHRPHSNPIQRRRAHRTRSTTARSRPSPPRHTHRQQQRRSTGLKAVVDTLQQLQRLLGD